MNFSTFRRATFILIVSTITFTFSCAKEAPGVTPALKNAVILIIRHAEKPDDGPGLTPEGQKRAEAYVNYFKKFTVDGKPFVPDHLIATADSKESQRPRLTIEPLAHALGLKIDNKIKNKNTEDVATELRSNPHGKQILISWHHGEIPLILRGLGVDPAALLPEGKWPGSQFAWVLQLRFDDMGRLIPEGTKRISEKLMPGDE